MVEEKDLIAFYCRYERDYSQRHLEESRLEMAVRGRGGVREEDKREIKRGGEKRAKRTKRPRASQERNQEQENEEKLWPKWQAFFRDEKMGRDK